MIEDSKFHEKELKRFGDRPPDIINKHPHVVKPDAVMRNTKLNFEHPDFWFMKGYDYVEDNLLDDALDSYRKAIRLNNRHLDAMNNMACIFE